MRALVVTLNSTRGGSFRGVLRAVTLAVIAAAGCATYESGKDSEGQPSLASQLLAQDRAVQPRHDSLVVKGPFAVAADRSLYFTYAIRSTADPRHEGAARPAFGLFLVSADRPRRVWTLEIWNAGTAARAVIDRIGSGDVLVHGEDDYGFRRWTRHVFFDARTGQRLGGAAYGHLELVGMESTGDSLYALFATDGQLNRLVTFASAGGYLGEDGVVVRSIVLGFGIAPNARLRRAGDTLLIADGDVTLELAHGAWSARARKVSDTSSATADGPVSVQPDGIAVGHPPDSSYFPFEGPDYDAFARWRPGRVADGYSRDETTIESSIASHVQVGDSVWFGTGFYDGESRSGVGVVGSFAIPDHRYDLTYLKEVVDWSVAAIAAQGPVLWIALAESGEGATNGHGVLRWDRGSGDLRRFEARGVPLALVVASDRVFAGTSEGIYAIRPDGGMDFVTLEYGPDSVLRVHVERDWRPPPPDSLSSVPW